MTDDHLLDSRRNEAVSPPPEQPPQPETVDPVIRLLEEWMADESGYDEETWPLLKDALNRERERVGARKLFPD